jgi:hypothetical protein
VQKYATKAVKVKVFEKTYLIEFFFGCMQFSLQTIMLVALVSVGQRSVSRRRRAGLRRVISVHLVCGTFARPEKDVHATVALNQIPMKTLNQIGRPKVSYIFPDQ